MRFFPTLSPTVIASAALLMMMMVLMMTTAPTSQASAAEFKQTPAELLVSSGS
jgi:hypothetical protein